jgi:hypothetical protein
MSIFNNSVFGTIKQSFGNGVACRTRGQNVLRTKPASYNDANTLVQRQNRAKQVIKSKDVQAINDFIKFYNSPSRRGATSFSDAMRSFQHTAISFTGAVEGDTVETLIPKSTIDFSKVSFGNARIPRPIVSIQATWDGPSNTVSVTLVDISGRRLMPADASYKCILIKKTGIGAFYSNDELPVDTTDADFEFEAGIEAGVYGVLIGVSNDTLSALTSLAGEITIT